MLCDLDFSTLEIVSAVKNINDLYDEKSVLTTITFQKDIKLQASYTQNSSNSVDINKSIKVLFNDPNQKYKVLAHFDYQVTPEILQDVSFIERMFETTDPDLKKVYL